MSECTELDIEVAGQTSVQIVSFTAQINDEISANLLCIPYNPSYWTSEVRECYGMRYSLGRLFILLSTIDKS